MDLFGRSIKEKPGKRGPRGKDGVELLTLLPKSCLMLLREFELTASWTLDDIKKDVVVTDDHVEIQKSQSSRDLPTVDKLEKNLRPEFSG